MQKRRLCKADCRVALPFDGGKENNNKGMIEILLTMDDKKKIAHDMHQEKNDIIPMTMTTESKTMLFPPLLSTSRTDNTPRLADSNGGSNNVECLPIQNREKKEDLSAIAMDAIVHDSQLPFDQYTNNMPLDIGRTNKGVRRPVAIRPSTGK